MLAIYTMRASVLPDGWANAINSVGETGDVHVFKRVCVAPSTADSWDREYGDVAARHLGVDSRAS